MSGFSRARVQLILLVCVLVGPAVFSPSAAAEESEFCDDTQHERIVVGTVQTLTAPDGSLLPDAGGTQVLSGFRFWVDHMNSRGGIKVGNKIVIVELLYYDDAGSAESSREYYEKLVYEQRVDFLLAGGSISEDALFAITNNSRTVTIATSSSRGYSQWHPLFFQMHVATTFGVIFPFEEAGVFVSQAQTAGVQYAGFLFHATENPTSQAICNYAMEAVRPLGVSVSAINSSSGLWREHIDEHQPQILIACTQTQTDVLDILATMVEEGLLYGWDTHDSHAHETGVHPNNVQRTSSLMTTFFTSDLTNADFSEKGKGWIDTAMGWKLWDSEVAYSDPYFIGAHEVNELWKSRGDFGNGESMNPETAAAIGSGVVLQLAIESAQSLDAEAVAAAMHALDQETMYGQVKFDAFGRNVGHKAVMIQWQCPPSHQGGASAHEDKCQQRVVHPAAKATGALKPMLQACPPNALPTQLLADSRLEPDADSPRSSPDTEPPVPVSHQSGMLFDVSGGCTRCVDADVASLAELRDRSEHNLRSIQAACSVFREAVLLGGIFTQKVDAATALALTFARDLVLTSPMLLPNVPLELVSVPRKDLQSGDQDAIAGALRSIASAVQGSDLHGVVWSTGQTEAFAAAAPHLAASALQSSAAGGMSTRESHTMFTWHNTSVSMVPPTSLQARGLVRIIEHFEWDRVWLIAGADEEYAQMGAAFVDKADALGKIQVLDTISLPVPGDPGRADVLQTLKGLDDCKGRVMVLCLGAADAEAVFASMRDEDPAESGWSGRWVFLTSEEAARAQNIPPGLLSLRSVAQKESQQFEDLTVHLQRVLGRETVGIAGLGIGFKSDEDYVYYDQQRHGTVLLEDRAWFAYDAVLTMCHAVWLMLKTGDDVRSPDALRNALMRMTIDGATGPLEFDAEMQRTKGRYALVNWDGAYWTSLAYWDLGGSGVVVHTVKADLRQSLWKTQAVAWPQPDGTAATGQKPGDVCDCVIFSSLPASSFDLGRCRWSASGVAAVLFATLGVLVCVCCTCWRCCTRVNLKQLDAEELLLQDTIERLRQRLHITRAHGFFLSSEPQLGLRMPWQPKQRVLQRAHIEAVARLLMLAEFDIRAFDAFASALYTGARSGIDSQETAGPTTTTTTTDPMDNNMNSGMNMNASWRNKPTPMLERIGSSFARMPTAFWQLDAFRDERPYLELQQILLETSRLLLLPTSGHSGGGEHESQISSQDETSTARSSMRSWSRWQQHRLTRQRQQNIPRTGEEQFGYFQQYVTKVQMWIEDDHRLFQALQMTVVQELMDVLHVKCDEVFKQIKEEPAGPALVNFQWPQPFVLDSSPRSYSSPLRALSPAPFTLKAAVSPSASESSQANAIREKRGSAASAVLTFDEKTTTTQAAPPHSSQPHLADQPVVDDTSMVACVPADASLVLVDAEYSFARKLSSGFGSVSVSDAVAPGPFQARARSEFSHVRPPLPEMTHRGSAGSHAHVGSYASVTRQDHPAVRAIRRDDEDEREVELQRASPAVGTSEMQTTTAVGVLDEDVYISQLFRRAVLLNDGFQERVFSAVEAHYGAAPLGGEPSVPSKVRVHAAPVKTKARMKEKLVAYAARSSDVARSGDEGTVTPVSAFSGGGCGTREQREHPLTANILDPVRCTVVCRGAAEMLEHVRWLLEEGEALGLPVVRVKNKFSSESSDEYDGYRDLMLCVLYSGERGLRLICEIQVHHFRLHKLKLQMHKLYKVKRAATAASI